MNFLTWFKIIVSSCLGLFFILCPTLQANKHGECISEESQKFQLKHLNTEAEIIKDAAKVIKSHLEKPGHPSVVRCVYMLDKNIITTRTTKVYYDEYRKRPDFYEENYIHKSICPEKVVEVFYNKHDKSFSLNYYKDAHKHQKISSKEVSVPKILLA